MNFRDLPTDTVLSICQQMDDQTFLNFLQTSTEVAQPCLVEYQRRLLESLDPTFLAQSQDPYYVTQYVWRMLEMAVQSRRKSRELGQAIRMNKTRKRSDQIYAERAAFTALSESYYERIRRVLLELFTLNPAAFWATLEQIYQDPRMGPNTLSILTSELYGNQDLYPGILEQVIARYPEFAVEDKDV